MFQDDVLQVLTDAREHMMTHGKCVGLFFDSESRVCMDGAVRYASGAGVSSTSGLFPEQNTHTNSFGHVAGSSFPVRVYSEAMDALFLAINSDYDGSFGELYRFSDHSDAGTVLDAFDRALAAVKEKVANADL